MARQVWDRKDVGYATRILPDEVGEPCLACKNLFSLNDKVYVMHKTNGTTIMCSSLFCFKKQGGQIDEYQINTTISRKSNGSKPQCTSTNSTFESKEEGWLAKCDELNAMEKLLKKERSDIFAGQSDAKLGMYMKMIDDSKN